MLKFGGGWVGGLAGVWLVAERLVRGKARAVAQERAERRVPRSEGERALWQAMGWRDDGESWKWQLESRDDDGRDWTD